MEARKWASEGSRGVTNDFAVKPLLAEARKRIVLTVLTSDEDGAAEEEATGFAVELGLTLELVGWEAPWVPLIAALLSSRT